MHLPNLWFLTVCVAIVTPLPTNPQTPLKSSTDTSSWMRFHLTDRKAVPGDSPAYYVGDLSSDILSIEGLDLIPNPPVDYMTVFLVGNLKSGIGDKPRVKLTASLNGTVGPSVESELCSQSKIEIRQNGTVVCPPKEGKVQMAYSVTIPYWLLKKGNYTVHAEMYATDGSRMTNFEGTVFVDGEAGDGDDGW